MAEERLETLAVHAAGAVIPKIGLGTWQLGGEQCSEIVPAALSEGCVNIDTAQGHANEGSPALGSRPAYSESLIGEAPLRTM